MEMTRKDPPPNEGGGDHLSDPKKRDPGTADGEFARFREKRLKARRRTQKVQRTGGSKPLSSQERARREINGLEDTKAHRRSATRASSREALARARQEFKDKQESREETQQAPRRPSGKLSREAMLRGRAEVQARDKHEHDTATFRRPSGKLSRQAMERARLEREALETDRDARFGRRRRADPPSDPAVRGAGTSDDDFVKFRKLQLRRQKLEALGLDKNPDVSPEESHGAFFGTTPVERTVIRGHTASFRAEDVEDLGEHHDEVVSDLQPIEGIMDEIPGDPEPEPASDDWLEDMD